MVKGNINIIGLGPGDTQHLTPAGRSAIEKADVIVGYTTYIKLIADLAPGIPRQASGMRKEVERAREAVSLAAQGKSVAVISSGDPGIYGMAGLLFEMQEKIETDIEIQIYPGISALNAAASLLGAPLMTDFAVISLSDQLVPLEAIHKRLEAAAQSDFILCLYNPKSRQRIEPFELACETLLQHRSADTLVGIVRKAYRQGQEVEIISLQDLPTSEINMLTVIIVGNHLTEMINGKMVTRRGYHDKYDF